jgi:hypothetical protein
VFNFPLTADEIKRTHATARPDGRIADPAGRSPMRDRNRQHRSTVEHQKYGGNS